jgi:hypothetical protein
MGSFFLLSFFLFKSFGLLLYTDPGSGLLIWQMLAAFFVGSLFYVTVAFRRIKLLIGKLSTFFGLKAGGTNLKQTENINQ